MVYFLPDVQQPTHVNNRRGILERRNYLVQKIHRVCQQKECKKRKCMIFTEMQQKTTGVEGLLKIAHFKDIGPYDLRVE